jgi:hypothetical protein
MHACALRDVLRDVGAAGISGDPEKLVRRFDEVTAAVVEPLYRATLWNCSPLSAPSFSVVRAAARR